MKHFFFVACCVVTASLPRLTRGVLVGEVEGGTAMTPYARWVSQFGLVPLWILVHITTLLQRVGKSGAKAVSRRAGHANLSTTLEVYQTIFEEDDRALADISAGLFNRK